jgi:hypothetical protein
MRGPWGPQTNIFYFVCVVPVVIYPFQASWGIKQFAQGVEISKSSFYSKIMLIPGPLGPRGLAVTGGHHIIFLWAQLDCPWPELYKSQYPCQTPNTLPATWGLATQGVIHVFTNYYLVPIQYLQHSPDQIPLQCRWEFHCPFCLLFFWKGKRKSWNITVEKFKFSHTIRGWHSRPQTPAYSGLLQPTPAYYGLLTKIWFCCVGWSRLE